MNLLRKYLSRSVFTLAVIVCLAGCQKGKVTGVLVMNATSEQAPMAGIWLTFAEIAVGDGDNWVAVNEQEQSVNLLDQEEGPYKFLAESTLAAGLYNQIRLRFSEEKDKNFVLIEGEKYPLSLPESLYNEIILSFDFEIIPRQMTEIFIDFNTENTLVENDDRAFTLQPTLSVVTDLHSGSITGKIKSLGTEATVYIYPQSGYIPDNPAKHLLQSMDVKASHFDPDRAEVDFSIYNIPEGIYDLVIVSEGYMIDTSRTDITVESLGVTDIGTITLIPLG